MSDPHPQDASVKFEHVHAEELQRLAWRRERVRLDPEPAGVEPDPDTPSVTNAHRMKPFGVSFSGGGIRSATFNLGILQGLAEHDLLRKIDYLSTVSGGGYIGSWLHGFIKHHCDSDMVEATCRLSPTRKPMEGPARSDPIAFLRKYSNYLAPSPGLFSADTWVIFAIWLRNVLLNQLILLPALAVPMLLAIILVLVQRWIPVRGWAFDAYHIGASVFVMGALFVSAWGAAINLRPIVRRTLGTDRLPPDTSTWFKRLKTTLDAEFNDSLRGPLELAIVPLLFCVGIVIGCADLGAGDVTSAAKSDPLLMVGLTLLFALPFFLLAFGGGFSKHYASLHMGAPWWLRLTSKTEWLANLWTKWMKPQYVATVFVLLMSFLAAAVTFWLLHELLESSRTWHPWNRVALVPVLVHLSVEAGIILFIGLMGADYPDGAREWVARVGTRLNLVSAAWLALFAIAVWGPFAVAWGLANYGKTTLTALVGWVAATGFGVSAGRSSRSTVQEQEGPKPASSRIMGTVIAVAPTVFMVGYLLLISFGVHKLATWWLELPAPVATVEAPAPPRLTIGVTVPEATTPIEVSVNRSGEPSALDRWFDGVRVYAAGYFDLYRNFRSTGADDGGRRREAIDRAGRLLLLVLMAAVLVWLASRRININEFSLHHFYKNRLVRCYLGASHGRRRRPNALTGFDPADDFALSKLQANFPAVGKAETGGYEDVDDDEADDPMPVWQREAERREKHPEPELGKCDYGGPYPIINTTLNVNVGIELAQQERKAVSFVFTPEYCGFETWPSKAKPAKSADTFDKGGYRKTWGATHGYSSPDGPSIGQAMAISGAAANPNSGYATTNAMAFLLTVFDARLGWWLGNPRWRLASRKQGPSFALGSLLSELFAQTTARSKFVNLSDGGHFDNLGLYELVRRRCRYIIIGDGEQDGQLTFGSLGGAIRKCRADFGVEIAIDPTPIRLRADGRSKAHCVVGTITYPEIDPVEPDSMTGQNGTDDLSKVKVATGRARGWILYLKSSLTGNEPADVIEYQSRNLEFPHQSTGDQFFSESQFESYRRLGLHVVREALEGVLPKVGDVTTWAAPPAPAPPPSPPVPPDPPDPSPKGSVAADVKRVQKCKATSPAMLGQQPDLTTVFQRLTRNWYPPIPVSAEAASRLNDQYGDLIERLGASKAATLLDAVVADRALPPAWSGNKQPGDEEYAFLLQQIGLMENVFTEFGLDHAANRANPQNRGWMRLFRQWATNARLYDDVWPRVKSTYNPLFQSFMAQLHDHPIDDVPTQN